MNALVRHDLSKLHPCAFMAAGVEYCREHFIFALTSIRLERRRFWGSISGTTENQQICDHLLLSRLPRDPRFTPEALRRRRMVQLSQVAQHHGPFRVRSEEILGQKIKLANTFTSY